MSSKSRRTRPPVFTSDQGKWSIGSEVVAFWWVKIHGETIQHHDVGIVARLHRVDRIGPWRATVTFGPLLDLTRPTEYDPDELLAAAPYDPEEALKAWDAKGR